MHEHYQEFEENWGVLEGIMLFGNFDYRKSINCIMDTKGGKKPEELATGNH